MTGTSACSARCAQLPKVPRQERDLAMCRTEHLLPGHLRITAGGASACLPECCRGVVASCSPCEDQGSLVDEIAVTFGISEAQEPEGEVGGAVVKRDDPS